MKLEMTRGCICSSLTVDGVEEIDLNDSYRKYVIRKICESMDPSRLNLMLQWYLSTFGEYECDDEPCECCGDYVEHFEMEI